MWSLKAKFKEDGTPELACIIWDGIYGVFDDVGWELQLEEEYMQLAELSYKKERSGVKGCFAKIITHQKNEVVKSINKCGRNSDHGGQIRMKRKSSEITPDTKFKKRKKGTCLGLFYNLALPGETPNELLKDVLNEQKKVMYNCNERCDFCQTLSQLGFCHRFHQKQKRMALQTYNNQQHLRMALQTYNKKQHLRMTLQVCNLMIVRTHWMQPSIW